jgi:hypothetical protein
MKPKMKLIAYWTATGLVAFALLSGGVAQLLRQPQTMEGLLLLGYPAYVATILGAWKVLGAASLLLPWLPRVKEWAYAGTVFLLTGAAASHAFSADYGAYAYHLVVPLAFAGLALVSRALCPFARGSDEG